MKSVAEILESSPPSNVEAEQVEAFVADLTAKVESVLEGWDRHEAPLRVTKTAIHVMGECPRKWTAPNEYELNVALARGQVVDEGARTLSVSTLVPGDSSWEYAVTMPLLERDARLAEFVEGLDAKDRYDFHQDVSTRLDELKTRLGSIANHDVLPQHSMVAEVVPGVLLSAKPDFVTRRPLRSVIELKSGKGRGVQEELAFYALVDLLHSGRMPDLGIGVTLGPPSNVFAMNSEDLLELGAKLVVETLWRFRAVDEAVVQGRPTPVAPGAVCGWCPLRITCPDVDEDAPVFDDWKTPDETRSEEPW